MMEDLAKSLDRLNDTLEKLTNRCQECFYYFALGDRGYCTRPDDGKLLSMEMEPDDFCSKFYRPDWYLTDDKGGV